MHATSNTHAETALPEPTPSREAIVQDRPTLGSLPRARRRPERWLVPTIDFVSSSLVLTIVALLDGAAVFPALPVAPLVLLGLYGILGVYGAQPPPRRSAKKTGPLAGDPGPDGGRLRLVGLADHRLSIAAQLSLWLGFVAARHRLARAHRRRHIRRASTASSAGSWSATTRPPSGSRPTSRCERARPSSAPCPPPTDDSKPADRVAALEIVDRYHADRVVIASQHADDEGLLELVRAFKSIGVPVSLLPRPLDLLEAPAVTPSQVGGVPLIEVEALAARRAVPYAGPDRRATAGPRSASSSRR